MVARDLYTRTTSKGKTTVHHHRVWDADLFVKSLGKQLQKEDKAARFETITEREYLNEK